ncbi:nucleotidyltransferase [Meiothermus sp.]|uniref:nucleotidyltransferase n=1 Tax=Meiothermus sp. TaxID=1955249 RepID=UPI002609C367|nr:nucleotidyltransferase [Meiothermus sp.]
MFASLNAHEVKYLVIGGIAAVLYGVPRATLDLDILIEATHDNAARLLDALAKANITSANLTSPKEILSNDVTVFKDRIRLDVQTNTPGLDFEAAWERRNLMQYQGQPFYVVSLEDLIASKVAAGRPKDLEDVEALRPKD